MAKRIIKTKDDIESELAITDDKLSIRESTLCKLQLLEKPKKGSLLTPPPMGVMKDAV